MFVSVDDPYDTISPYHDWTVTRTAAQVATGLKYVGTVTALTVDAYPSGRVKTVTADGTGGTVVFTGATARTRLGLRSTWFAVGGPPPRVAAASQQAGNPITLKAKVDGARVDLHGLALPGTATLQAPASGSWRDVSTHAVGPDGALAFRRPFGEAARYRVSQGEVRSNEVAVQRATPATVTASPCRTFLPFSGLVISELTTISVIGVLASVSWLTKRSMIGNFPFGIR